MRPGVTVRVDTRVQRTANPNHVLEQQFAAEAGFLTNGGRVAIAGHVTGNSQNREMDQEDSSIYDFNTYAEGEEGIRLLIQNGFDRMDLWLVGKVRHDERHPLGLHGNRERIEWQDRRGSFWSGISGLVFVSAWKAGPHKLMMHGNSAEASKAHNLLVEHTNRLIEECLRFR
jgi:hypothetical protein